jgi:hypothetical protein
MTCPKKLQQKGTVPNAIFLMNIYSSVIVKYRIVKQEQNIEMMSLDWKQAQNLNDCSSAYWALNRSKTLK